MKLIPRKETTMNYIKKALTTLGGIFLAALLIAALAPKATHGLVAALVQVANTTSTPVPVTDIKDQNPYQETISFSQDGPDCFGGLNCMVNFKAVPAGYRLVITNASAEYALASGGTLPSAQLLINGNFFGVTQYLPKPTDAGLNTFIVSSPISFYVNAGDQPSMALSGQFVSTGAVTSTATIVGYLVPVS